MDDDGLSVVIREEVDMNLMKMSSSTTVLIAICVAVACVCSEATAVEQRVFLDFDSGVDGSIVYTTVMRDAVEELMVSHYAGFDVVISQTTPAAPFSQITFNAGATGVIAQHIDFRNLDPSDTALVNVDGIGFVSTAELISASAILASQGLGHLMGLRHGDAFGPIGLGIHSPPGAAAYFPAYPGPSGADETLDHIMATPAALGLPIINLTTPSWFSERAACKLQFSLTGSVIPEDPGPKGTLPTAQPISLDPIIVPNTIVAGDNADGCNFSVDAVTVLGTLSVPGELDIYSFDAIAGDLFNFEVISNVMPQRIADPIDSTITILDSTGTPITYYSSTAINDDEFETFDSILIDLSILADDTYYVVIDTFSGVDTGSYELFGYRFSLLPACPADIDCSGSVNVTDLLSLLAGWGPNPGHAADINGDGQVNVTDLLALLAAWGACP